MKQARLGPPRRVKPSAGKGCCVACARWLAGAALAALLVAVLVYVMSGPIARMAMRELLVLSPSAIPSSVHKAAALIGRAGGAGRLSLQRDAGQIRMHHAPKVPNQKNRTPMCSDICAKVRRLS